MLSFVRRPSWIPLLLLWILLGCTDPEEGWSPGDTPAEVELEVVVNEFGPTAVSVTWTVSGAEVEDTWLEYGVDDEDAALVQGTDVGGFFGATLVGLTPDSEYRVRAAVATAGGTEYSDTETFVTAPVPTHLPDGTVTYETLDADRSGFIVTSLVSAMESAAVIYDDRGQLVWWHPFEMWDIFIPSARLSRDRESVIYLSECSYVPGQPSCSRLVRVDLDGSAEEFIDVPNAHHDFAELPDGTLAVLVYAEHEFQGEPLVSDAIVEVKPGGEQVQVWSVWDHVDYANVDPLDYAWAHGNALDYDEQHDEYQMSLRNLGSILRIDHDTGEVLARVGGVDSDYEFGGDPELFVWQHQFQFVEDRVLVFDNGDPGAMESRAVEYRLDDEQGVAELLWEGRHSPPLMCFIGGDVSLMQDDHRLITWSTAGVIEEVLPDGEPLWAFSVEIGTGFGYSTWVDALSHQAQPRP